MATEQVLLGQVANAGEVISALIWLHVLQQLYRNRPIKPSDVPIGVLALRQVELELELGHLLDNVVVGVLGVHNHAVGAEGDLLRVRVPFFLVFVARSEPVRVI